MVSSFPPTESGKDRQAIAPAAQTAERLGYGSPLVFDHGLEAHPKWEPKLLAPYASTWDIALGEIGCGK
jgi:hypothetical protein